jgi:hypothetical protein
VTGFQNWGALEYSVVSGGPVLLWGVRRLLTLWYDYRVKGTQEQLDSLSKERDATIEKLKLATKYDSTQQLIDKYSGKQKSPAKTPDGKNKRQSQGGPGAGGQQQVPPQQGQQRVFTQPPPTANIPRGPIPPQLQGPPSRPTSAGSLNAPPPYQPPTQTGPPPGAEFAPNAFADPDHAPAAPASYGEATWYDRILDALLGEDETSAKNRFALICSSCKLVNGQAPPGARTLEDVGKWRCSACGAMNGVENETAKLVKEVSKSQAAVEPVPETTDVGAEDEEEDDDDDPEADEVEEFEEVEKSPAASTRSKKARTGKKS